MSTTKTEPTKDEVDAAFKTPGVVIAESDSEIRVALVHPQWGGYCFPVAVQFGRPPEGKADGFPCFEVYEFADEDFPKEYVVTERHYCDPSQIVKFGIEVMEAMARAGHRDNSSMGCDLEELANRLDELAWKAADL